MLDILLDDKDVGYLGGVYAVEIVYVFLNGWKYTD